MLKIFFLLCLFYFPYIRSNKEIDDKSPRIDYLFHWEDKFTKEEKAKIKSWLDEINLAVVATLGNFQFDVHLYVHRTNSKKEPVPWANTDRYPKQAVHFHVNPDFDKEVFLEDWTAQHEISHLSIPFIGSENMWFSEGYASYMQYQIMHKQGVYTKEEMNEKYKSKFEMCYDTYQNEKAFPDIVKELKKAYNYPEIYWGGAYFFKILDDELQEKTNISLLDLIKKYQACCRAKTEANNPKEVIESWDEIIGGTICKDVYLRFTSKPASSFME